MIQKRKDSARTKLRTYFLKNIGKVLHADQLRKIAGGITEWARRIRELRNEEGYQILTHNDRDDLRPGEYLLENSTPLPAFARDISKEVRAFILDRNGFTCQMCGAVAGESHPYDSSSIIHLAKFLSTSSNTYHLLNSEKVNGVVLIESLRKAGYPLETCSFDEWKKAIFAHIQKDPDDPAAILAGFLSDQWNKKDSNFSAHLTLQKLKESSVIRTSSSSDWIEKTINFFIHNQYFPSYLPEKSDLSNLA